MASDDAEGGRVVGVIQDGITEWHASGGAIGDYVTLCGLDGNDPTVGQTGVVKAANGQRIDCAQCYAIWRDINALRLTKKDFTHGD